MANLSYMQLARRAPVSAILLGMFLAAFAEGSMLIPLAGLAQENASACPECIHDVATLFTGGAHLSHAIAANPAKAKAAVSVNAAGAVSVEPTAEPAVEAPARRETTATAGGVDAAWEAKFERGLRSSQLAINESDTRDWTVDTPYSGAAIPRQILQAEVLLEAGSKGAPDDITKKAKTAERALRLFYHARWLADRNLEKAAEWRYLEAARLAKSSRRSLLAAHALSRLGYFLITWNRRDEARDVLVEAERLNTKANPLAPFLLGVIDRQAAGNDMEMLRAAEDRILMAAQQPSEELEADRHRLIAEIKFWRGAEHEPMNCLKGFDFAHVIICFLGHAMYGIKNYWD